MPLSLAFVLLAPAATAAPPPTAGAPAPAATTEEEARASDAPEADGAGPDEPAAEPAAPAAPAGGGVVGNVVDQDDPDATRATAELEGEALDENIAGIPERMPPLRAAGWWTMFGAVTLGTTGGVFAGLAEAEEDKATRIAARIDIQTGMAPLYADERDEYEKILDRGNAFQWVGRTMVIAGGAALVTSVALFIADGRKTRRRGRMSLTPTAGGMEVRF